MPFLVFQLQAPLASWGVTAVGEYRGSDSYPGESALVGLLGAALGIRRDQEALHIQLAQGYGFAVGVLSAGKLLRDYHTAQVPGRAALKKRPHFTRMDELDVEKEDLNTILSTRDYRQDAACLVGVQPREHAPYPLEDLSAVLQKPRFVLYLGRKSCPPSASLWPRLLEEPTVKEAFSRYLSDFAALNESHKDKYGRLPMAPLGTLNRLVWGDGVTSGVDQPSLTAPRKDRLISRCNWQFGDRTEYIAFVQEES